MNGCAEPVFGKLSNADMAKAKELATENSELIMRKWFETFDWGNYERDFGKRCKKALG